MTYTVELSPAARKQLRKLPRQAQGRILRCLEDLEMDPRPPGAKKLADSEKLYRIRSGNYRIVYQVEDEILLVLVVKIAIGRTSTGICFVDCGAGRWRS